MTEASRPETIFHGYPDYLTLLLNTPPDTHAAFSHELQHVRLVSDESGILECLPASPVTGQPALVLSCGIHGNETAPIELVNRLLNQIVAGELTPAVPMLILFGHPAAMQRQVRFIDQNLNRLFCGKHATLPEDIETRRARQIEQAVERFATAHRPFVHYDLHTAIRPSHIEKFALVPFVNGRYTTDTPDLPEAQWQFLTRAGISAVIFQHKEATTFASHTAHGFGAQSFTLELGKVHPFGQNDLSRLSALTTVLEQLIQGHPLPDVPVATSRPDRYVVCHEIIHDGDGFQLNIPDDVANFTAFSKGFQVWHGPTGQYCVAHEEEFIVFPNRKVPPGQRAGLMLKKLPD